MSSSVSGLAAAVLAGAREAAAGDDGALVAAMAEVEQLGRAVDAARVRLAGEAAYRSRRELGPERLSARLGCRTAGELVQRVTGVSGAAAARRMRLGLATRRGVGLTGEPVAAPFEAVAHALDDGAVGVDAAHAIVVALEPALRVALPDHVAAGERELVAAACESWGTGGEGVGAGAVADGAAPDATGPDGAAPDGTAPDGTAPDGTAPDVSEADDAPSTGNGGMPVVDADAVRLQARAWAEYLDPDGAAPDDRDAERRFLTLHPARRGLVPVSGLLLPEVASALTKYADAWTNPKTEPVPDPTAVRPVAEPVVEPLAEPLAEPLMGESRSRAQVLHDVLATVVAVAARAADAPSVAGNPPTLVVVARAGDLRAGSGVAHTDDGTPVSLATARHVGCGGAVQRVVEDESGRIVGLWSSERVFTGAQRRAIAVRDGGCVIPGCQVPPAWCEVHHVVPHAQDPGGTHTDNGVLLCWHHHRTIETSGWRIRMVRGMPWVRPPDWLAREAGWRPARVRAQSPPGRSTDRRSA